MELYSEEILRYLGNLNSQPEKRFRSERIKKVKAIERVLLIGAGSGFLMLLAMIPVKLMYPSGTWINSVAQTFGSLSTLCFLAYMLADIASRLFHFKTWKSDMAEYDVKAEVYLREVAVPLLPCLPDQLNYVDGRLADRYDGISQRTVTIFGEGVAKAGALAFVFEILDKLGKLPSEASVFGVLLTTRTLTTVAAYSFVFFIVAPLALKLFSLRYPFQRRVIKVALELKKLSQGDASAQFAPPDAKAIAELEKRNADSAPLKKLAITNANVTVGTLDA